VETPPVSRGETQRCSDTELVSRTKSSGTSRRPADPKGPNADRGAVETPKDRPDPELRLVGGAKSKGGEGGRAPSAQLGREPWRGRPEHMVGMQPRKPACRHGNRRNPMGATDMKQGRRVRGEENRREGEKPCGRSVLGEANPGEACSQSLERRRGRNPERSRARGGRCGPIRECSEEEVT